MKMPALLTSVSIRPNRATPSQSRARRSSGRRCRRPRPGCLVARGLDRSRRCDDAVAAVAVGLDQGRANALRRTGDNSDFLFDAHGRSPSCVCGVAATNAERFPERECSPFGTRSSAARLNAHALLRVRWGCRVDNSGWRWLPAHTDQRIARPARVLGSAAPRGFVQRRFG